MRDKQAVKALFLICKTVREIVLQNCWGLEDEVFATATVCRYEFCHLVFAIVSLFVDAF
jgi:hypothetical protein